MMRWAYSLSFAIFCLLLSLFVLVSDPFFTQEVLKLTSPPKSAGPTAQLFDYFFGLAPIPSVFNEREVSHLRDVRNLLWLSFFVLIFAFILSFSGILAYGRVVVRNGFLILLGAAILGLIVPFNSLFWYFHLVFFPQGNWIFPANSTLITFYPSDFFLMYSIAILVCALCFSLVLFFALRPCGE
ncbi:DUF1461 domain-containing protein [Candidatus Woesearchaeota archaeon]|nr:MAG: DUF1461 domain-containing protein [Candidatus Woesearchaeota archaeon]